ncbi:zinc finger protein 511 isoform X2 [Chelonus insularis]|uniref:zinc finger protein 511 isoform X2 n=1 Tax=Chelonus insularis TaxID=460826 RepID=UPI001588EAC4|nr:zinc finger protein 511 isoform X2 [Chelonus insularis]
MIHFLTNLIVFVKCFNELESLLKIKSNYVIKYIYYRMNEFSCNAPGCQARFRTLIDFEVHYNSVHRFTCSECKTIKPNPRLLEIHIQEVHDSFFKILAEKEPMYQCFVSDCNVKFKDATERKHHCIIVHKFPKHFKYKEKSQIKSDKNTKENDVSELSMEIDQPVKNMQNKKKPNIKLNKNQKTRTFISNMKTTGQVAASEDKSCSSPEQKSITSSALQFIPRQLTHKSYSKILTQNKIVEKRNLDSENVMMELSEALPS